MLLKRASTTQ